MKLKLAEKINEVKRVWRAVEHLVAALSLAIVSIYAGIDAYNTEGMRTDHRVGVVAASIVIAIIASRELYKYFSSVKIEG